MLISLIICIVVIIKKFQLEVMFPMNIKTVFSNKSYILTENELKFIDCHLFNYEFLVSMKIIMPSKEEMRTIMSQMNNMTFKEINSLAFIDKMYYTIAQFPEMTIFINSMISIIEMKNDLDEINQSLMNISALFESILINDKLKYVISIMLKINNYLNKSTGGRELKGFDLVSLENVLDLKINSVYFFNIVGNYYIVKYPQQSLFNKTEFQYLNYALSYFSNAIEQENMKECFIKQYKDISKEIETIVQNPYIKESLYKLFMGNVEGMIEKVDELKTKEMELKERLNEYLLLESQITKEEYYAYLIKLFKIILKIEGKVKCYLGIKSKNNVIAEVNCDKVSHKAHHPMLLTEGITTAYKSNPFISNYIQNNENIYVHNEDNELKESNGINTMIVSHMKESISIQSDNLSINKGQHKHNFPISGFFLKKYCL